MWVCAIEPLPNTGILLIKRSIGFMLDARIAQLVEQRIENPCVPGSNPGSGTTLFSYIL